MAIEVGDALLKLGVDPADLNRGMKDAEQNVKSSVEKIQSGLKVVGAAFTAVGAAGLKLVSDAKQMNAELSKTAINLGVSTKEMRDLALSTTNVTFPLKEVIASFDLLARAGVDDAETMEKVATAFDTLGDATGSSASQVTNNMIPAMKTFGLTAEEMADKVDMFTYLNRETTLSLDDFNTMVGYTTPELVEMGLTVDDLAAAIIHMEKQGYAPGRVMTREFMKATTKAREEQIPLTEALGMTSKELEAIQGELAGATGMTQEYADAANEQFGIMDKVKQKWSELTLQAGSFLEPLEPVLAGMTAMGPVMMFFGTSMGTAAVKTAAHTVALIAHAIAVKAVTAAQWLWNAAMMANPLGLIIAGIAALIAGGIALWQNWDKVAGFFESMWQNIKIFFLSAIDAILGGLDKFLGWIPGLGDKIREARETISGVIDAEKIKRDSSDAKRAIEELISKVRDSSEDMIGDVERATERAIANERELTQTKLDELGKQRQAGQKAHDERMKQLQEEYIAQIKLIDEELAADLETYQSEIDTIDDTLDAEARAERERQNEERIASLRSRILNETDADKRAELETELAELLQEIERENWRQRLQDQKDNIRERMDARRKEAEEAKKVAQEEYDAAKELEEQKFSAFNTTLDSELEALKTSLEAKVKLYEDDFEAFKAMCEDEESFTTDHIGNLLEEYERLTQGATERSEAGKRILEAGLRDQLVILKTQLGEQEKAMKESTEQEEIDVTTVWSRMWEGIVKLFQDNWRLILGILFPPIGLAMLIADKWGEITEEVTNIWNSIIGVFSGMWETAFQWGINLVEGLWAGIKSLNEWIKDKVTGWAKGIFNAIKKGFGDLWPFSPSEAGVDIGRGLVEGIRTGVEGAIANVHFAMRRIEAEITVRRDFEHPVTVPSADFPSVRGGLAFPGDTTNFYIAQLIVREEADVPRIARELERMRQSKGRQLGVI